MPGTRTRPTRRAAALVATALAALAAAPAAAGACDAHERARPPASPGAPLALGDSVMLGAVDELVRAGFEVDARGCRQMRQGLDVLRARRARGTLPRVVVVALGTNWVVTRGDVERALRIVGPGRLLGLVTPRETGGGESSDARVIRDAGRRHPDRIAVLDWARHSRGRAGWFGADGIHLTGAGAAGFARLLGGLSATVALRGRIEGVEGSRALVVRAGRRAHRIALLGIDAPDARECAGAEARARLLALAFTAPVDTDGDGLADAPGGRGRTVAARTDPTQPRADADGRLLAYVSTSRGRALAPAMLEAGLARVALASERAFARQDRFLRVERAAREAGRGAWSACDGDFHRPAGT
jgi:endonuclease YncB( thermonuclease family)